MFDIRDFKQDKQKAEEGIIRKFGDDAHIRVARADNPKYQKKMRGSLEQYRNFRRGKIPAGVIDDAVCAAVAETILLEMKGFRDGAGDITGTAGAVIEDTYENRLKVLKHEDYVEFRDLVANMSQDFDQYRVAVEEEEEGNSASSSSGLGVGEVTQAS
jgi:hypothetical protein